jgi:hypothetical protein
MNANTSQYNRTCNRTRASFLGIPAKIKLLLTYREKERRVFMNESKTLGAMRRISWKYGNFS